MDEALSAKWYVAHTYSGYENKVKANIEAAVQSRNMEDVILEVVVPLHEVEETKSGKRTTAMKKIFPGYVLVKMHMTDESWFVVRNTRGVTGFVGPGSKPVALSNEELVNLGVVAPEDPDLALEPSYPMIDLHVGEDIRVIGGPFEGFEGRIEELKISQRKLRVNISIFGRETPVELDFDHIEKL
ncbi:MAG: transcription termination/antitermination protein NusG [Eubacteriaceae bacterium]|nr:transcription termination/antitermination protein NusG [Eubacteriaceae bacterium]